MKCGICKKKEAHPDATVSVKITLPVKESFGSTFGFELCAECWDKVQRANAAMVKEKGTDLGTALGKAELQNLRKVLEKITDV